MHTALRLSLLFLIVGGIFPVAAEAKAPASVEVRVLSFETAQKLALSAAQACRRLGFQVAAAVVDRNGQLLAFARDPLAGPHTIAVSQAKAYSAATFQTPTSQMRGREALQAAPGVLLVGGGVPVRVGGYFYGAVGVSGAPAKKVTGDQDEACARAGIEAIREALEFDQ
ncbi:MAG: heme-binding protein [Gammaproteobacteria bacterium]